MGWVRIDDAFYDNPKFLGVGALGMAIWIAGLAHANRNLTDGMISRRAARGLVDFDGVAVNTSSMSGRDAEPDDGIRELLDAGIWHASGHDCESCPDPREGEYYIHDYLSYQPSRQKVESERAAAKERMRGRRSANSSGSARDEHTENRSVSSEDVRTNDEGTSDAPKPKPKPKVPNGTSDNLSTDKPSTVHDLLPVRLREPFERFWAVYPLRKDKAEAKRKFEIACRTTDPETIIAGAERYAASVRGSDPKFVKHAPTWLHRGCWEDEPAQRVSSYAPGAVEWPT